MTFRQHEDSRHSGAPQEFFLFAMGTTAWRVTSGDAPVVLTDPDPETYEPLAMSCDQLTFGEEDTAGDVTITIPCDHAIAQLFVGGGPSVPLRVVARTLHRADADAEIHVAFTGEVIACDFEGPAARLKCAPMFGKLRRLTPGIAYQAQCAWVLFGAGCSLNADDFQATGTVTAVSGRQVTAVVFGTQADGWWRGGWIKFADGRRRFVVAHTGTTVTLMNVQPGLAPGDAFDVWPGCDRTEAVCAAKFSNLVNHMGFPRIPHRNPYERSIV